MDKRTQFSSCTKAQMSFLIGIQLNFESWDGKYQQVALDIKSQKLSEDKFTFHWSSRFFTEREITEI